MTDYSALFTGKTATPQAPATHLTPPKYRLLIVDDEVGIVKALTRVFRQENYEVVTAGSGDEALKRLAEGSFQLVISDFMMPGMNGAQFLREVKQRSPETIRIMLTGHADTDAVMGAINDGAVYKFILKPWNDDDLRVTVALALEQFDLIARNRALKTENDKKSREISALSRLAVTHRSRLGIMLHKKNLLNAAQLQELTLLQERRKEPLISLLIDKGWVGERQIRDLLKSDMLIEEVQLPEFRIDPVLAELIPHSFCQRQLVVPLKLEGRRLLLAMADPLDEGLIDEVRFTAGLDLKVVTADTAAIRKKISELYGDSSVDFKELETLVGGPDPYEGIEIVIEEEDSAQLEDLLRQTEAPPAIRLANAIILEAIRLGASDIHIQPRIKSVIVRYRIDGVLADKINIPHHLHQSLVSRLKIMSELDISERRRPQDGRITVKTPMRMVDLRISTLPTINGEKVVMRILDRNSTVHTLDRLGFSPSDLPRVADMVAKPQGIILATGPTGSGKTTTLYSVLNHINSEGIHIMTLEDPVEYPMALVRQTSVAETSKLDFANGIRSMMRQDPDVILVGEIRDAETAEMAFRAAMTGHQVYSTLHTNSAIGAMPRLLDIGVLPDIMAGNVIGVVAQRLVRRLCPHCKTPYQAEDHEARLLGPADAPRPVLFRPCGCERCDFQGYRGRLAIMEILRMNGELDELVARRSTAAKSATRRPRSASCRWRTTACAASSTGRPRWKSSPAWST